VIHAIERQSRVRGSWGGGVYYLYKKGRCLWESDILIGTHKRRRSKHDYLREEEFQAKGRARTKVLRKECP
jgi:hypothetical protein